MEEGVLIVVEIMVLVEMEMVKIVEEEEIVIVILLKEGLGGDGGSVSAGLTQVVFGEEAIFINLRFLCSGKRNQIARQINIPDGILFVLVE